MPKAGRGRGSSSAGSKHPRSSSTGRVAKGKQTNTASTAIAHGSVGLDEIDTNLLHANYRPRSPILTRQQTGASRGNSGQQQQQQSTSNSSTTTTTTTTANVPTSNEFEVLSGEESSNDDDGNSTDDDYDVRMRKQGNEKKCNSPKERRPPPIYVLDTLADDVDELLQGLEYCLKIGKKSVTVITLNKLNFGKVVEELKLNNFKFYTFEPTEKAPVKIVLQGYKDRPIAELEENLSESGVNPREVKVLSRTKTVTGTYTLYLLYFDRGSVKIQDLRRIKTLDGFFVTWRFFTKSPTDAAQCHRCQKFGHGSRNCNLPPRCVKCGENHFTEKCNLPRKDKLAENNNAQQHKPSIKCANCGKNHTANFRGCAVRKTYLEEQKKKKTPATSSPLRTTTSTVAAAGRGTASKQTFPPGWGGSYANVAASGGSHHPEQDAITGEDLFTLPEFFALAAEMLTRFRVCRNKAEQFLALGELMMKHIYSVNRQP